MANAGLFPMGTTVKICRKIDDKTGVPFHMADIVPKCHSGMLLDNAYVVIWELGWKVWKLKFQGDKIVKLHHFQWQNTLIPQHQNNGKQVSTTTAKTSFSCLTTVKRGTTQKESPKTLPFHFRCLFRVLPHIFLPARRRCNFGQQTAREQLTLYRFLGTLSSIFAGGGICIQCDVLVHLSTMPDWNGWLAHGDESSIVLFVISMVETPRCDHIRSLSYFPIPLVCECALPKTNNFWDGMGMEIRTPTTPGPLMSVVSPTWLTYYMSNIYVRCVETQRPSGTIRAPLERICGSKTQCYQILKWLYVLLRMGLWQGLSNMFTDTKSDAADAFIHHQNFSCKNLSNKKITKSQPMQQLFEQWTTFHSSS